LSPAVVVERATRLEDSLPEHRVGHVGLSPHCGDQLVPAYGAAMLKQKINKTVEDLGFQWNFAIAIPENAPADIDGETLELENALAHAMLPNNGPNRMIDIAE
jgi:hypothetical protein